MYYELNREREREMISKELLGYYGNCMSLRALENMAKVIKRVLVRSVHSLKRKVNQSVNQIACTNGFVDMLFLVPGPVG